MQSAATSVAQYVAEMPDDRREAIQAIRKVILANMDPRLEEGMTYGMIGYYIPHRHYPAGYHCDPKMPLGYSGLASQKNYMSFYSMCVYGHMPTLEWFQKEWAKTGKKLDMGKSCIRFKKLDDNSLVGHRGTVSPRAGGEVYRAIRGGSQRVIEPEAGREENAREKGESEVERSMTSLLR